MPATEKGWLITANELQAWIIEEREDIVAVDKPAGVVCHPSKQGPWSSLGGACREYFHLERVHMPFRLDRETSGVVLFAKSRETASRLQIAVGQRRFRKTYWAILCGHLAETLVVREPVGRIPAPSFAARQWIDPKAGQTAETEFVPLARAGGYTFARVHPITGRLHQIRVHAAWSGYPVVGDKLYPDASLMAEFVVQGFTDRLAARLPMRRHALHAGEVTFDSSSGEMMTFRAPIATDLAEFCRNHMDGLNIREFEGANGTANPNHY